jgi:hypothetical protein
MSLAQSRANINTGVIQAEPTARAGIHEAAWYMSHGSRLDASASPPLGRDDRRQRDGAMIVFW